MPSTPRGPAPERAGAARGRAVRWGDRSIQHLGGGGANSGGDRISWGRAGIGRRSRAEGSPAAGCRNWSVWAAPPASRPWTTCLSGGSAR